MEDTCITFVVPSKIILREYKVSLKIVDDEIKNFAKLMIQGIQWGDFISAQVTASLHGTTAYKVPKYGQLYDTVAEVKK